MRRRRKPFTILVYEDGRISVNATPSQVVVGAGELTLDSKTGAVLRDRGGRDEHGMQPLEDIFSSPRDGATTADIDDDDDGSGDMEIASSTNNCCGSSRAQK